jgi:undecaprenyl diphosphate synthase
MSGEQPFSRLPQHIGFIPDGNRRWAVQRGLTKAEGYAAGIPPGFDLMERCLALGIKEVSIYGFTQDNTRRPKEQTIAFQNACVAFAQGVAERGVSLRVLGDTSSALFPSELLPYAASPSIREGLQVNFLVNYGWQWDIQMAQRALLKGETSLPRPLSTLIASAAVPRLDLIVRWGGCRRLSGFLPIQSVYADFYVVDALWPDYRPEQFYQALRWYETQDSTLGG